MTTITSNAFTVDDLEAMPSDGKRYELIGGAIVMTPAPEPVHQRVELGLVQLMQDACPPGHEAFVSQWAEPDIIVVPNASVGDKRLAGPGSVDWPVAVSFSVADLARPRAR